MPKLDKKDWKILELVCENARLSHNQIAKRVGLSKNAVTYRIERLQKKGIIGGFFTIINHPALGLTFHEILFQLTTTKEQEQQFRHYFTHHPNVLVCDRVSGEFNYIIEIGTKNHLKFLEILHEIKTKFSDILDLFEVHPILESYKVEQLPVELVSSKKKIKPFDTTIKKVEISSLDERLLVELNRDATQPLHILAQKLGVTSDTIRNRMRRLEKQHVILRYTAKIQLYHLEYDTYLVTFDLHKLSTQKEKLLRSFLITHPAIRYAFMSASVPRVFIHIAAKSTDILDQFLLECKEQFGEIIVGQRYLIMREQYKYNLFPQGLLK